MSEHSKEVLKAYELAKKAREKSYSPYSKFKVGAALKCKDSDKIHTGHNIENISFPAGNCAEPVVLYSAIAERGRGNFEFMVIVTDTENPTPPCGICRQVLSEHVDQDFVVYLADLKEIRKKLTISELLPYSFDSLE